MARLPETRTEPRITANDLALFMVSSDTARLGIVRRAKHPQAPPIIRYRDVRPIVCNFLADDNRAVNRLVQGEEMFRQRMEDAAETVLRQDDARASVEVLGAVQRLANQLGQFTFRAAPANQSKLDLAGVEVSVRADLLVSAPIRNNDHAGVAVLRLTQDDAGTDAARTRRREMGLYVATLARVHIEQNLAPPHPISNRLCMSIDIQHGEVFQTPDANTRRRNDLENACRFISAIWAGA